MATARKRKTQASLEDSGAQIAEAAPAGSASEANAPRPPARAVPYSGRFSALIDPTNDQDDEEPNQPAPTARGAADESEPVRRDRRGKGEKKPQARPSGTADHQEASKVNGRKSPPAVVEAAAAAAPKAQEPSGPSVVSAAAPAHPTPAPTIAAPEKHPQQPAKPTASAAGLGGPGHKDGSSSATGKRHSKGGHGGGAGSGGGGGGSGGGRSLRRRILRRSLQWLVALSVAGMAALVTHRRLLEENPQYVSELLQDGISLPSLSLSLPRPSLDSLLASTGLNASVLLGITDTLTGTLNELTDTLNDLTDSISGGRLSVSTQLRALLSQLPAFSLPQIGGGGGTAGAGSGTNATSVSGRPGLLMARQGYRAKHPVVIVPGFITSGLELWRGLPCGQRYFRQRMWGTLAMVQAFLTDPTCWFRHMELDPVTGLDPEGIRLRAAVGLEAVDYFIQGYWVWGKLVEALADVGYDSNSLISMPYDWRLAMPLLEERDGYFTRLRSAVETLAEVNGERVVIATHSYGDNVVRSFMAWVESSEGGQGWVERHIACLVNIAGTTLGVPKSVSALLSGETRDTAQLGALAGFLTSNMVPRATRTRVWRTWGSSYAMLPVGGPAVWGNASWAPDDTPEMRAARRTYGAMASLWPHNWQSLFAAAAAAAASQPQQLNELVANISQQAGANDEATADEAGAGAGAAGSGASEGGRQGGRQGAAVVRSDAGGGNNDSRADSKAGSKGGNQTAAAATGSSSPSSSPSGSSPMTLITDTLKKLVSSGGGEAVDPTDHLHSEQVTRLDVTAFLALLREVGGPLVDQHTAEWGAVDLANAREGGSKEARASDRAARAADRGGDPAGQAAGGPDRLRQLSSRRRRLPLFPDATRTPLPNAPSTTLVCLYGVGLPTERGYHYLRPQPQAADAAAAAGSAAAPGTRKAAEEGLTAAEAGEEPAGSRGGGGGGGEGGGGGGSGDGSEAVAPPHRPGSSGEEANAEAGPEASSGWMIMRDVSQPEHSLDVGVHLSDGDGTVPLLSLGLMCRGPWRRRGRLNPGGMRVVTREFKHRSVSLLQDARGGPATAAHVEILGNEGVLADVIRVAAGRVAEVEDLIVTDIDRMAAEVQLG